MSDISKPIKDGIMHDLEAAYGYLGHALNLADRIRDDERRDAIESKIREARGLIHWLREGLSQ